MTQFSNTSMTRLNECDQRLINLFMEVIKYYDCTVICGHRNQIDQDSAYERGSTKLKWPDGKHNTIPSKAVDVSPYPVDWKDNRGFVFFGGFVLGIAKQMNINIRWGGLWSNNLNKLKENTFNDLVHFELVD